MWKTASNNETVKHPRSGHISSLETIRTFKESTNNKFSISNHTFNAVPVLSYPARRGPSIFLDKSGRGRDLSRKIEGPLPQGSVVSTSFVSL